MNVPDLALWDLEAPEERIPVGHVVFIRADRGELTVDVVLPVSPVGSTNRVIDGIDQG